MISMIWAEDEKHGIGKNQSIPWNIPDDMAFFKKVTSGNTVIMGRKTFESIGRALPNRKNIVVTHEPSTLPDTVFGVSSFEELKQLTENANEDHFYVMGGGYLYHQLLNQADELLITKIRGRFDCDVNAPTVPEEIFKLIESNPGAKTKDVPEHTFERWIRR